MIPEVANLREGIDFQRGLIGWFDILGYKSIIENNQIEGAVFVVRKIQAIIERADKRCRENGFGIAGTICGYVLFSDTIVLYCPGEGHMHTAFFTEFSADLVSELFWAGLPVRGAWAFGAFHIHAKPGSISLAGPPIIEACKLAERLDLAACAIAPSAEAVLTAKGILDQKSDHLLGFVRQAVPLKGQQRRELFMLNHYAIDLHYNPTRTITRQAVEEQFAAHKKPIGVEVLPKVNNTLEFLRASRPSTKHLPTD
jgi:hypothetical protein